MPVKNGVLFCQQLAFIKKSADTHGRDGEKTPNYRKTKADLPHNINGQGRIIPDVHFQKNIDDEPCAEFHCCNNAGAGKAAENRGTPLHFFAAYAVNEVEADTASQSHGKICASPAGNLQQRINGSACAKQANIFFHALTS